MVPVLLCLLASAAATAVFDLLAARSWRARWQDRGILTGLLDRPAAVMARRALPVLLGTAAGLWYASPAAAATVAALTWVGLVSAFTDLSCCRIPREPSWFALGLGAVLVAAGAGPAGWASAVTALVITAVVTAIVVLVTRGGLGSGDVRLLLAMTPLAGWAGYTPILVGMLIASVLQVPLRMVLRRWGGYTGPGLPFGPALVIGTALAVLLLGHPGSPCDDWALVISCS